MTGKQIQRRRGTTAEHSTFTGALGELTVDTDKKTVVVHDGSTAGGSPLAVAADVASAYAPLASPALTGVPTAPTATAGTNTTQVATTAFVKAVVLPIASTAQARAGTDDTTTITPKKMRDGFNAAGSAPVYACRAWVNFNGTGTVGIRASGNVSSITDNGVGDYTVNFTTAMPDDNYIFVAPSVGTASNAYNWSVNDNLNNGLHAKTATAHRVRANISSNGGAVDAAYAYLAYFR